MDHDNQLGFPDMLTRVGYLLVRWTTSLANLEMEGCSEEENGLNKSTLRKRQRTSSESEEKKKRTGTLLDLDATDCPVCFDSLSIPIFQCENGHIACSTCCGKLNQKCATCSLTMLSRNRAMERILELLTVPCPNAGCYETVPYTETSTHVKHCAHTHRPCPFSSCDFICSFKDLFKHCESSFMFECGTPVFIIKPSSGKRIILKELTDYRRSRRSCGCGRFRHASRSNNICLLYWTRTRLPVSVCLLNQNSKESVK